MGLIFLTSNFDWTLSTVISVCALLFGGLITLIWKDVHEKHSAKHKERKKLEDRAKTEEQAELIRGIVKDENQPILEKVNYTSKKVDSLANQMDIISEGTQSTLRNQLLTCFYKCNEKHHRTENDTMNFSDMYESYHKLRGNSFIDKDIKPRFYALPLKQETYKSKQIIRKGQKKQMTLSDATKKKDKKEEVYAK